MKKILLSTFSLVNLSFFAIACEYHDEEYYSPYNWNAGSFNHASIEEAGTASYNNQSRVPDNNQSKRPDFRYNRAQRPVNDEEKSQQEQDDTEG